MESLGKVSILGGCALIGLGLILLALSRIPGLRLGRLPGDLFIQRSGMIFYAPFATMLLLSFLISAILWAVRFFRR